MLKKILNIGYWGYKNKIPGLSGFINRLTRLIYSCDIPSCLYIPKTVEFKHKGLGISINAGSIIGENVIIHQNVTIGKKDENGICPVIKDNVFIGASAIILGNIVVGENAKIGAGAIVVKDVPSNATVVNASAKIVKKREDKQ